MQYGTNRWMQEKRLRQKSSLIWDNDALQIWMHFLCELYSWHHTSPRKKSNLSALVTVVCEKTLGRRIYS